MRYFADRHLCGGSGGGDAPKEEEKKVEAVEEEVDMGGAMDMFGGGGDGY